MQIVQVIYHEEPEGWWAESPDVPGYGTTSESLDELRELAREGIPFYLEVEPTEIELDERFPTTVVSSSMTTTAWNTPAWNAPTPTATAVLSRSTRLVVSAPSVQLRAAAAA